MQKQVEEIGEKARSEGKNHRKPEEVKKCPPSMYKTIRKRTINKERKQKKDSVFIPYKRKGKEKKNKNKEDEEDDEEDDEDRDGEKKRDEDKDEDRKDDEEGNKDGDINKGDNFDAIDKEDNFDEINKNKEEVNKENDDTAVLGHSHVLVEVKQEVIEEEKKPKGNKEVIRIESDVDSLPFSPLHFCKHSKSDGGPSKPIVTVPATWHVRPKLMHTDRYEGHG